MSQQVPHSLAFGSPRRPLHHPLRNFMRIDSHQHFWRYSPAEYPWIQPSWPLRRDFLPADLAPELEAAGIDGCVAVQARQTMEETRWLLELAGANPWIRGVVGWVDLCSPSADAQLAQFVADTNFVGVRHVLQDEPDDRFMLREDFQRGLQGLAQHDLAYDLLIFPRQLPAAIELVQAFPGQRFVLDHLAKPSIREGTFSPWREHVRELALLPNIVCKVSGMVTEASWEKWTPADLHPYLDVVSEAFGPERLLFGSDWPVALLAARYAQVAGVVRDYFAAQGPLIEALIFGQNAVRFYRL